MLLVFLFPIFSFLFSVMYEVLKPCRVAQMGTPMELAAAFAKM